MQKEDLIRRMRLFAVVSTLLFVVLVVGLLVQFGFIASYHHRLTDLEEKNAQLQKQLDGLDKDNAYYGEDGAYKDDQAITH